MKVAIVVFLGAWAVALLLVPYVARVARSIGLVDEPNARKVHVKPMPRVGGIAFVIAFFAASLTALLTDDALWEAFVADWIPLTTILVAAVVMFVLGLLDDVFDVPAKIKFMGLLGGALAVAMSGARIDSIGLSDAYTLPLGPAAWPVTVLWIIGVTVSINFIDGLDGLAAGISLIGCGVVMVLSIWTGQTAMVVLMAAMMGALTGFLFFNFNPARIFMGDCGSMFLGFLVASATVLCASKTTAFVGLGLPALALGVPIFDTTLTFIRRGILERRSIFSAERGHVHHRLVDRGLRHHQVVLLIYLVSLLSAGLGLCMLYTHNAESIVLFGCGAVLLAMVFRTIGSLRPRQISRAVSRNRAIRREASGQRRQFEASQLKMRITVTFDAWWANIRDAAERLDFAHVSLTMSTRAGTMRVLKWDAPGHESDSVELVTVTLPIRHRRAGDPVRACVQFSLGSSLESAGRALALFSRLLDEHSIADLPTSAKKAAAARPAATADAVPLGPQSPTAVEGASPSTG